MSSSSMHWFRKGLRLHDNPALLQSLDIASKSPSGSGSVYPVYVLDGDCYQLRHCNALRANFLVECLADLDKSLRERGSRLYVVAGNPAEVLPTLWKEFEITHMTHEGDETGEPYAKERDENVHALAKEQNVDVRVVNSETLYPLGSYVAKVGNNVEKVPGTMSAFQGVFNKMGGVATPKPSPRKEDFPTNQNHAAYDGEMLCPKNPMALPWPRNIPKKEVTPLWGPEDCKDLNPLVRGGESEALSVLRQTTKKPAYVASYEKPKTSCTDTSGASTTALSPYMSLGCLSPRTFWHAISEASSRAPASTPKSKPPVSLHGQLLWRDFNNLIAHAANVRCPGSWGKMIGNHYCREIPWDDDNEELLQAWKLGQTGYPWIDACMAQLRTEGWLHHLGRHAVACFLTRGDLWISWIKGAAHFEEELLDADYALNNFNWLWLSCSGFFYQYFRCYSPVAFQQKNDKNGDYIRKWLPQLKKLPPKYIYEPWKAPVKVLKEAGVELGKDYPLPIVEHSKVSKENMSKMSLAYDIHKEKVAAAKATKSKRKSNSSVASKKKKAGVSAKKQKK